MPERLECEVLQKVRYINTLTFTFFTTHWNFHQAKLSNIVLHIEILVHRDCVFILSHQWVTSSMSHLALLVACHFVFTLFSWQVKYDDDDAVNSSYGRVSLH